ncbi:ATP synthase subunit f, mitochondrial-like isoform X2 [Rhinopithecus roxellana]|nr:ATP synthase subunit f, mitochondrial-like isoform X2 [Rhinopithecus roxellana]
MASVVPMKDKTLLEVKLGELPSWILMQDFSPSGVLAAFQREHERLHKYY